MNVVILTEGGKDYGFGHVARCGSIYQAFQYYNVFPKFLVNGDNVNLEFDILAKYVEKNLLSNNNSSITADFLAENGFV